MLKIIPHWFYKYVLAAIMLSMSLNLFAADQQTYMPDPAITAIIASNPAILHDQLIKSMKKILISPATLTIEITHYNPELTARGRLQKIEVFTSRGMVDNLILDRADIEFEDVQLDTKKLLTEDKIDPVQMKNINMDVVIKETDLNNFLSAKSKSIKVNNPLVDMKPGKMELSGSAKYGMFKVKFWATGGFSIINSKEIWFHARRMKVNHLSMPRSFTGMIVKKINPVFKLDSFPFKLNLKEIRIDNDQMVFTSFKEGTKK